MINLTPSNDASSQSVIDLINSHLDALIAKTTIIKDKSKRISDAALQNGYREGKKAKIHNAIRGTSTPLIGS